MLFCDSMNKLVENSKELIYMTKSIAVLMRNLREANPEVRSRAAIDLGENKAEEAVSSLAKVMLTDEEPSVRSVAAEALGTIANPVDKEINSPISLRVTNWSC